MAVVQLFGLDAAQLFTTVLIIVISFLVGQFFGSKITAVKSKNVYATPDGFKTPTGVLKILIIEFIIFSALAFFLESNVPGIINGFFQEYGFLQVGVVFAILIAGFLWIPLIGK